MPHPFSKIVLLVKAVFLTLLMTSCSTVPTSESTAPETELITDTVAQEDIIIARQLELDQQWDHAAALYQYLAERSEQPMRSSFNQKTALMLYRAGHYDSVESFYGSLNQDDLIPDDEIYKNVLLAGVYFERGKTYQSLVNLPELDQITAPFYKALALNVRSKGVLAIGKPLESAQLRIEISQFLEQEIDIQDNYDFIWDALNRITEPNMISALSKPASMELRGWLELNLIARRSNMLPAKIEPWIEKWHELYPQHEAAKSFAADLLAESKLIYINPTHVALMLPLSNKFKNVSEAIQNGFLYAYYNDPRKLEIEIDLIDVSDVPAEQFFLQYNQAIDNGADFVVGPLSKEHVNALARLNAIDTPTLTLNYADDDLGGKNNLYQFGLRPEDEAEQIADYALSHRQYHAVTLLPDTTLGDRLQNAFTRQYEKLGGRVVGSTRYPATKNDYSVAIKQLLHINASQRRHSILQQVTGENLEFIPRRRQDIDMVFMSGNPRQARLLKPQLKFHHAIHLPVYATSSISSSTSQPDADRDLDETLFVDSPWALQNESIEDYQAIRQIWPQDSQRYSRFFAMGIDAYHLIPSLRRLLVNPEEEIPMHSGTVTVDSDGRIHRKLLLATYKRGRASLIPSSQEVDTADATQ